MAKGKSNQSGSRRKLPPGMQLRGSTYYARFSQNGKMTRERLSRDLDTAKRLLRELRVRADEAGRGATDNNYKWVDLKREFLTWARQSIRQWDDYKRDLEWFEKYRPVVKIDALSESYVIGFRQWRLDRGITPRTVNKHVATLSNMLAKGVGWGRIGFNPIAKMKQLPHDTLAKERRSLTLEETEALFEASPTHLVPVWRMFLCTGIRKAELVNMRFEDIDFDYRSVTVHASRAKNHKAREIPLDDTMLDMLAELKRQAVDREPVPGQTEAITAQQLSRFTRDHVFVTETNTPMRNNLLERFYRICVKAGIEDGKPCGSVDIHSLRVSFATLAMEHGANPRDVQAVLGHSTLEMTMKIYAKATDRGKRNAINSLPFAAASGPAHVVPMQSPKQAQNLSQLSETPTKPLENKA
jgi:integrase